MIYTGIFITSKNSLNYHLLNKETLENLLIFKIYFHIIKKFLFNNISNKKLSFIGGSIF